MNEDTEPTGPPHHVCDCQVCRQRRADELRFFRRTRRNTYVTTAAVALVFGLFGGAMFAAASNTVPHLFGMSCFRVCFPGANLGP